MTMALSHRLARPLLASIFVVGGWDALRNPAGKANKAEAVTEPLVGSTDIEGLDTETLVRINGAVQVGAGLLLALGKWRRLAALALIGSIIPTTYAGHRFWEESDPTTRKQQQMHFLKNVGLLGGLILATFDTEGEPSLAWRAKRKARQLEAAVSTGRASGHEKARSTRREMAPAVTRFSKRAAREGRAVRRRAGRLGTAGHDLAGKIPLEPEVLNDAQLAIVDAVKGSTETATHAVQGAASVVSDAARQLPTLARSATRPTLDAIVPFLESGADRTTEALSKLREHLPSD
jgi:uncharacterized membrane protein YphA (DoxX/SURF4 family)